MNNVMVGYKDLCNVWGIGLALGNIEFSKASFKKEADYEYNDFDPDDKETLNIKNLWLFINDISYEVKEELKRRHLSTYDMEKLYGICRSTSHKALDPKLELTKDSTRISLSTRLKCLLSMRRSLGMPVMLSSPMLEEDLDLTDNEAVHAWKVDLLDSLLESEHPYKYHEERAGIRYNSIVSMSRLPEREMSIALAIHCFSVWKGPINPAA